MHACIQHYMVTVTTIVFISSTCLHDSVAISAVTLVILTIVIVIKQLLLASYICDRI